MFPGDVDGTSESDVPLYSKEPALDERTLSYFERAAPTGTHTRGDEHLRLMLKEQADDAKIPSYGYHGLVTGEVTISEPDGITAVDIKVRRRQRPICSIQIGSTISSFPIVLSAGGQTRNSA